MKICILFIIAVFLKPNLLLSQCNGLSSKQVSGGSLNKSTGNRQLDSMINSEFTKLENFYHIDLDLYYLEESRGENAYYDGSDASVLLGRKLMSKLDFTSMIAVLAHEFGHAMQHVLSWSESGKRPELHSDFLAGYYMGKQYSSIQEKEISRVMNTFYSIGDHDFFSPDHHGSPNERYCAFYEGYNFAKTKASTVEEACMYGFLYVEKDSPCLFQRYNQYSLDINNGQFGAISFKCLDKKTYIVSYKDIDGEVKRYRINTENSKLLLNQMSINFIYIFNLYQENSNGAVQFINTIKIQPGRNLQMEIAINNWKVESRQFRIYSDYTAVNSNSNHAFKFTSSDYEYFIFDPTDKFIGKVAPNQDLFIQTLNFDYNYFNIYRFQGGKMIFEKDFSKDLFMIPQNGKSHIIISRKDGLKQKFIY
jgi:hypothetical protein